MGEPPVNFFGGSPLNRLSWLRESSKFLNAAANDASARWVVFRDGDPLMMRKGGELAYLTTEQVRGVLGPDGRVFGQGREVDEDGGENVKALMGARLRGPVVVFLGVLEREDVKALPTAEFGSAEDLTGIPYLVVDVSKVPKEVVEETLKDEETGAKALELAFVESRAASRTFRALDASVFSLGRSMIDWNLRNRFCAGCGSPVYSLWGGWKLSCSSLLPWTDNTGREPCITTKGLHNFAHPRTDAVVIMAVLDDKDDRILLGHNKKYAASQSTHPDSRSTTTDHLLLFDLGGAEMYSTLAGFVEPSESFEDAVKREIYEESGLVVHSVRYHSAQPWPYPANLMVGFYAFADSTQKIRLDLDNELEDARWFTREEVLAVLEHPDGTNFTYNPPTPSETDPPFRVPPRAMAIAGVLISEWAHGKVEHLRPAPVSRI